ncbi:hypothetical protein N665_0227s0067 [Sinapis alba]|nr:hypothetical protein N665_0227s0067 [Sinapis alba]
METNTGEYATARAASAAGTIMKLSSWATSSVEEVASTGPGIRFFPTLCIYKNRNVVEKLVRRAERRATTTEHVMANKFSHIMNLSLVFATLLSV